MIHPVKPTIWAVASESVLISAGLLNTDCPQIKLNSGLWCPPLFYSSIGCHHITPSLFGNHGNISSGGEREHHSIFSQSLKSPLLQFWPKQNPNLSVCVIMSEQQNIFFIVQIRIKQEIMKIWWICHSNLYFLCWHNECQLMPLLF